MVAPGPVTMSAAIAGPSPAGRDDGAAEAARIKAEILSARSEKQCTTCEGDQDKLDEKIQALETKLRQVQSTQRIEPAQTADSVSGPQDAADRFRSDLGRTNASETMAIRKADLGPDGLNAASKLKTEYDKSGQEHRANTPFQASNDGRFDPGRFLDITA